MPSGSDEAAILEFQRVGMSVKATAIDPATGLEVSIVGDARAGQAALGRAAVQKLRYVIERRKARGAAGPAAAEGGDSGAEPLAPASSKRGRLV
jgi:hypothetical protein